VDDRCVAKGELIRTKHYSIQEPPGGSNVRIRNYWHHSDYLPDRLAFTSRLGWTAHIKRLKRSEKATRASVEKEMAKPRVTKSARIAQLNLGTGRTPEPPRVSMPGTVIEIVPPGQLGKPESAQIVLDVGERQHRSFRIENSLTDEYGDDVKLNKGASVEVSVTAKDESTPD
jgi:hypothetical protein